MRLLRAALVGIAGLAAVGLVPVVLQLAHLGDARLMRFREPTLVAYGALALAALLRRNGVAFTEERLRRLGVTVASRGFEWASLLVTLALFLASALTQHWAFRTGSHDFSMIDEALWQSHHGRFMHSPVLGRSFLTEHFSPILVTLIPLHALIPSPYLLVILQPLVLWASALVLRGILRDERVDPALANLGVLVYLHHGIMVSTLNYLFHMECLLPLALFAAYRCYHRGWWAGYWASVIAALAVKEDVGLYVAGLGAYLLLADRRRILGVATITLGLTWVALALRVALPAFADGASTYAFTGRWVQWGDGILGIATGFVTQAGAFARAILARPILAFAVSLLFLPWIGRWTWLLIVAPWVVNSTSSLPAQARLSLYYGIPLLSFGALAATRALRSPFFERPTARRLAPWLVALAVVLNVSHLSFPEIPRDRGAIVRAMGGIPPESSTQLMWCLFPVAGYPREKTMLRPGEPLTADFVAMRTVGDTWPFAPGEAERVAEEAIRSGTYRNLSEIRSFYLLRRTRR